MVDKALVGQPQHYSGEIPDSQSLRPDCCLELSLLRQNIQYPHSFSVSKNLVSNSTMFSGEEKAWDTCGVRVSEKDDR